MILENPFENIQAGFSIFITGRLNFLKDVRNKRGRISKKFKNLLNFLKVYMYS